nr:hypothetical protein OH837_30570 [Streptomyces canus]
MVEDLAENGFAKVVLRAADAITLPDVDTALSIAQAGHEVAVYGPGFARPVPVEDDAFIADLAETAVRYPRNPEATGPHPGLMHRWRGSGRSGDLVLVQEGLEGGRRSAARRGGLSPTSPSYRPGCSPARSEQSETGLAHQNGH